VSITLALRRIADRRTLSAAEARDAFLELMEGRATESQKGALLLGLASRGETPEEVAGAVAAVREKMRRVETNRKPLLDTCGTGGHGFRTVNVSTAAAFACAGAGVAVAKHGNRSATRCGSADVLEALGVVIDLGPGGVARSLREVGIGFCFAPRFHSAMRFAGPVRSQLGVPTTFNFLGPLANPAGATRRTIGVSDPSMAERVASTLAELGVERALVFYGHDGLDELTVTTTSTVHELRDGELTVYDVDPADFGIDHADIGALAGGDAAGNAEAVHKTLAGAAGPIRDVVTLNAAAALLVADLVPDLASGVERAGEILDDGSAAATLEAFVRVTVAARQAGDG
jgi:anthranilate phosphoribosyltransferase